MNRIFLKLSSKELSTRYCVLIKNNFSSCITRNEHTCVLHVAYLEQKIYPQVIYRKLQEVRINSFKKQLGITLLLITQLVFFSHEIVADTRLNQLIEDSKQTLSETWDSSDYELYLPVNIWHNRHFYTKEKIDEYNEDPWGFGLGKYRYDTGGDWHAIYGMAFLDSHNKPQLAAGYAYQKMWYASDNLRFGAGYTFGATVREDYPFLPIIAPIASIEYKQLALQSTYIFGGNGNGNILFSWIKWQIK